MISRRPLAALLLFAAAAAFYYWPELVSYQPSPEEIRNLPGQISGRVQRVADGDSIEVKDSRRIIKIRLYGIDAPELSQVHGPEARAWLAARILNKTVRVERLDIDQYNRVVGLVFLDDRVINQELVAAGQAWVYNRYCSASLCRQMKKDEKEARRQELGLWRDKKPTPPWIWRRSNPSRPKKK